MTSMPADLSFLAVPPVDNICHPIADSALESSSTPSLCQTLISARGGSMKRHEGEGLEAFYRLVPSGGDDLVYSEHTYCCLGSCLQRTRYH